jgi:hypothetical protein
VHRFDLAVGFREPLQRTDGYRMIAVPRGPEANVWRFQCVEIQGMSASRRRLGARRIEMMREELPNPPIVEAALDNLHRRVQPPATW